MREGGGRRGRGSEKAEGFIFEERVDSGGRRRGEGEKEKSCCFVVLFSFVYFLPSSNLKVYH